MSACAGCGLVWIHCEKCGRWWCEDCALGACDEPTKGCVRCLVIYSQDGDMRCATRPDFDNLQESPAGFGATDEEALAALEEDERSGR